MRMARKTGDRMRGLDKSILSQLVGFMEANTIPARNYESLKTVMPITRQEETAEFGESLSGGIVLRENPQE
jgi:hypothetical protein